ncbi:XRE family transcriptional regulator [Herbaspirillum rubrisubalbicans]|jgi:HTH-type transcriptional regulator/antitoxin HipB|uniref:XRE family transcriptional regulator n=2 Tax=Herbaspirillum rubrisubalbicans TaxID=80842 RepID=A0ABX9C2D7_9BURK|nr:helix-turn-helix transcriptional regulator [Herbaspirillum rubrisubalbicans]MCP1575761.1 HTH-type transcriptional regulator/antitoxin HipB [Herbaspirillum rubrisubalbicans]QJP99079.1 XRE family transcriptional regulator [Herbaspirillum rubrisubalbicans Os34]RAM64360.1 XRE family transcriptional regulator [Herbaspirillum rubrisubalbicans]RAN45691.1 XRE family transcriptional regulator [Herbaspirillum rubrisubalbicans]
MSEFPVRTGRQLPELLQAYRKQSGMTQSEVARRLGVTQQNLSSLERNADKVSADRLVELLNILGVELVLRKAGAAAEDSASPAPDDASW